MVTPGRFELPTRSLGNCCSIHLSYGATFIRTTCRLCMLLSLTISYRENDGHGPGITGSDTLAIFSQINVITRMLAGSNQ